MQLVPFETKCVCGPPAEWRTRRNRDRSLTELEVCRVERAAAERGPSELQPPGKHDVGHHRGPRPNIWWDAGIQIGRVRPEPCLAGLVVRAALAH